MGSRVILTPRNDTSLTLNKQVLQRQVGDVTTYFAANHAEVPDNPDEAKNYPQKFLHILTPYGMPPHTLQLKVGRIVMLLRSLGPSNGLCNGTRLFTEIVLEQEFLVEIMLVIWYSSQR